MYAEYLWAGETDAVRVLGQLKMFERFEGIVMWLTYNKIRGRELIAFFNDAEGVETRGVLRGVKKILNYVDNNQFDRTALTTKDLV